MISVAETLEKERLNHVFEVDGHHKEVLGQYFTPYSIARFMSSLFPVTEDNIKLLDPGAGIGTLNCSFLERIVKENWNTPKIRVVAYDIDKNVQNILEQNLALASSPLHKSEYEIFSEDFLEKTSLDYMWKINETFTHVIMNPPYKKISIKSKERYASRTFGLETVNLYAAFMGAAISLTEDRGHIVAIVPRSFCNGVYYKPFREFILRNCAIKHIHLFESRNQAFKDESVLQENIIIMLKKNSLQENVKITYCTDETFSDLTDFNVPFSQILHENDTEKYFYIPTKQQIEIKNMNQDSTLADLNIQVSTGPIVDFRHKELLRKNFEEHTIPIIYAVHLKNHRLSWPQDSKKPNAIVDSEVIRKQQFPKGFYVLVKRFSTKEERKRIIASIITPDDFIGDSMTFENHLNIFHVNKNSLPEYLAYGLVCWLNSTNIDDRFRLFSGHTQVNATDLRNLPYPDTEKLTKLGEKLKSCTEWCQESIDGLAKEVIGEN